MAVEISAWLSYPPFQKYMYCKQTLNQKQTEPYKNIESQREAKPLLKTNFPPSLCKGQGVRGMGSETISSLLFDALVVPAGQVPHSGDAAPA